MPYEPLTRPRIIQALKRLAELAVAAELELELSLYGGAVFTLVYGSRDATKDIDAIIRPSAAATPFIRQVAREQGLPDDWLNSHVSQFLASHEEKRPYPTDDFGPGLRISVPTAAYLLALKLHAARPSLPGYAGDAADIRFLLSRLCPSTQAEVEEIYERFFPRDILKPRATAIIADYLANRSST